jgi:hydrogenase 3 maturation protease
MNESLSDPPKAPLSVIESVNRLPILVLGAGNAMRADDAAGCVVAERLAGRFPSNVIDGGMVPENFVGPIRRMIPGTVIIVDAADFGAQPGELYVARADDIVGDMFGTHGAPLALFMRAMNDEFGSDVILVAVQVGSMELNAPMTDRVESAVELLTETLAGVLERTTAG